MKTKIFKYFIFCLFSISVHAQKAPEKEVLFQVQNAAANDTISFKYESSGTPYLFSQYDCVYESKSAFSFTHTIIDDHTGENYYAHIVFDNDYPLTKGEMIHCLLKIIVSKNGDEITTFYYDTRDCQYYTQCDYDNQDITLRYDAGTDSLFFYDNFIKYGTASEGNGWEDVSGESKTFWGVKGISHCPLDFAGAPDTPANFSISGSASENPQLDWDDNDEQDLVGYYLYRNYDGSGYSLFDSVAAPTNTYTDNDYVISSNRLNPQVCYKISAYDEEELESSQTDAPRCKTILVEKRINLTGSEELIREYKLYPAFPNPFNPNTIITFQIPETGYVNLEVYDVTGRLVKILINENKAAGKYNITFDATDLSSGIYYYTIRTNNFISTKKMLLIK